MSNHRAQSRVTDQVAQEALYRPTGGGSGPSDTDAVVFDDSVPGTKSNIRENRAANRSAIDNTKTGITNLGSDTSGAATGSTGNYSTIGGGDQNNATGDLSTVPGGFGNTASGAVSYAEGDHTVASGGAAHAEGANTIASGDVSHAEGISSVASGPVAHAEGKNTVSSAAGSHSEGTATSASADSAHAEGAGTHASGVNSHAEGLQTVAAGDDSHAEGSGSTSNGGNSHAEGNGSVANADSSHAEGSATTTNGEAAHAEGSNTTSNGNASHSEGAGSTANGSQSHAEGNATIANGQNSHAQGDQSVALRESQDAFASGIFAVAGDAQTSALVLRGSTPGAAPAETVELRYGDAANQSFTLEDGKGYIIRIEAIATSSAGDYASFVQTVTTKQIAGVIQPLLVGTQEFLSSGGAGGWSLTTAIAAAPTRVAFTFATGVAPAAVHVACTLRFTEVAG